MRRSAAGLTALVTALATVTATVGALEYAEAATSGWTTPTTLSTPGRNATAPGVAVDGHGVVQAVWIETAANGHGVVEYARRSPGSGWTDPIALSSNASDANGPSIATNFAGHVVVAWSSGSSSVVPAVIRRRSPGGAWTPRLIVSAPTDNTELARATLNNDGDLAVSWENLDPVTHKREAVVRVRLAGKPWSSAHELGAHAVDEIDPQMVIDGDGNVTAAWTSRIGPPRNESTQVWVARKPAGATWRGATKVSGTSTVDLAPVLALRGGNVPWLAWEHTVANVSGIWLRHGTAAGWSPATRASKVGVSSFSPTMDANAHGQLLLAWTNLSPRLQSRLLTPAGHWKPIAVATDPGGARVSSPQLRIAGDGTAYVAWLAGAGRTLIARFAPRANAWREVTAVPGGSVSDAQLAVNPSGRAALVWRQLVDPARIRAILSR